MVHIKFSSIVSWHVCSTHPQCAIKRVCVWGCENSACYSVSAKLHRKKVGLAFGILGTTQESFPVGYECSRSSNSHIAFPIIAPEDKGSLVPLHKAGGSSRNKRRGGAQCTEAAYFQRDFMWAISLKRLGQCIQQSGASSHIAFLLLKNYNLDRLRYSIPIKVCKIRTSQFTVQRILSI
jgi:hypothetical protein